MTYIEGLGARHAQKAPELVGMFLTIIHLIQLQWAGHCIICQRDSALSQAQYLLFYASTTMGLAS